MALTAFKRITRTITNLTALPIDFPDVHGFVLLPAGEPDGTVVITDQFTLDLLSRSNDLFYNWKMGNISINDDYGTVPFIFSNDNVFTVISEREITSGELQADASAIRGRVITTDMPSHGNALIYDSTSNMWVYQDVISGDEFVYDDGELYMYDPVRDKYLTPGLIPLTLGRDEPTGNQLLPSTGLTAHPTVGYPIIHDMTIVGGSVRVSTGSATATKVFYIRKNNSATNLGALTCAAYYAKDLTFDIDLDADDYLQVFVDAAGGNVKSTNMVLWCKRRYVAP